MRREKPENHKATARVPFSLSDRELASLGAGQVGYIKEIDSREARALLGTRAALARKKDRLFCLYGANGEPLSISISLVAAISQASEHALVPVGLH